LVGAALQRAPFFDKPALLHHSGDRDGRVRSNRIRGPHCPALAALGFGARDGLVRVSRGRGIRGLSPGLLVANPGVFGLARARHPDTLFTPFLFGGAALVSVAALAIVGNCSGRYAIAAAVMAKAPALVLCGLAFGLAIVSSATAAAAPGSQMAGRPRAGGAAVIALVRLHAGDGDAFVQGAVR
jgi:hypothetical protein